MATYINYIYHVVLIYLYMQEKCFFTSVCQKQMVGTQFMVRRTHFGGLHTKTFPGDMFIIAHI